MLCRRYAVLDSQALGAARNALLVSLVVMMVVLCHNRYGYGYGYEY